MIDIIKKEWEGEIVLNPGTQHSKGTAVLFHKNITANKLNISNTHKSEDGRIVFMNITVDEKCLSLINKYAPNNVRDRKSFFVKLEKWITKFSNNNEIIMGGDFNSTEKNAIDRHNRATDISSSAYIALKENQNLCDIWRSMHPNKRQFTYREISRLDKFLVSETISNYIQTSNIFHGGVSSDHKCINLKITLEASKKGPGRWKMNTSILQDKSYIENIKILIENVKKEYKDVASQLLWEISKIKIKEYTIAYCSNKQAIKKNVMKEVEKQLELKEQILIDSNYRHSIQLERDVLVNSLHKLVEDQKKGAQIRSRAKWIEEGEKCTKFFNGLEQKNIANNKIRQLTKDDGNFTTSDTEILEEEYKYYQSLYAKENITDNSIKSYLQNIDNINTLSEVEANALEGELTDTECLAAINDMKTNKSPGSDGIPMEFHKVFWEEIRDIFLQSINEAYHLGELSPTQ